MKHNVRLYVAALLTVCCFYANAAGPSPAASAPVMEIEVLRAQLETTRQFQDSFMSMAQWTLGSAIAVALALAGFGWYTNKTSYERERKALEQEGKSIRESLGAHVTEEVGKARKELLNDLSGRQAELQLAVEKAVSSKITGVSARVNEIQSDVFDLLANSLEREAKEALAGGRHTWAIYKYGDLLQLYVKRGSDFYEAADVLDSIREIVKLPNVKFDADTVNRAVGILGGLPANHRAASESLIASLKKRLD